MNHFFTVKVTDYTGTVGHFLRTHTELTRRQISRAKFSENGIKKNGIRCRITEPLSSGDTLSICLEDEMTNSSHLDMPPASMEMPEILYEDSDLIAVNKPAGIVVHPSGIHYNDTLSNQIYSYYAAAGQQICCRSIGRLDKETSGIVLFAKNRPAASILQKQRNSGSLCKQYLAAVSGYLPADGTKEEHTVDFPLAADPHDPLKMQALIPAFAAGASDLQKKYAAKPAVTHYRTLFSTPDWSLVLLRLETGRTHQIRVHMAALGYPLLGDRLYGNNLKAPRSLHFNRAALHAWKSDFFHPFTGASIHLEAPFPEDFQHAYSSYLSINI